MDFLITDYGALADGVTNNAGAIQKAIDEAAKDGGRVVIPSGGTFLSGSILLRAKVDLHLTSGSRLLASSDYADYTPDTSIPVITDHKVVETVLPQRAFISAFQADHLKISGEGVIDGNADNFIETRGKYIHKMRGPINGRDQYLERPFTVFIIQSDSVVIENITIKDPAFWALRLTGCDNSRINSIKILTDLMVPNADGIDIDRCKKVKISNCELITADDCISLKSCAGTSQYGDVDDVVIKNCYMKTTSGAITVGTESVGDIKNIIVTNCTVEDSHRGFAVRSREGGLISNVKFMDSSVSTRTFNESWWGHGEALHVTAFSWSDPTTDFEGNIERGLEGRVENIEFVNLKVDTEAGVLNWAARKDLLKNIRYEDIEIKIGSKSKWESRIDLRPNDIIPVVLRPHNAIEIINCDGVSLDNVKVIWGKDSRSQYGELIKDENSSGTLVKGVTELVK